MHLIQRLSVILALLLGLAACGGSAPTTAVDAPAEAEGGNEGGGNQGSGNGDDACLNTNEEVSAAFGVQVSEAENTETPGGGASCIYYVDKESFEIAYTIGLSAGGNVAQTVFDSFSADETAEAVSGIGDEAVWYAGGLIVRQGDRLLSLGAPPSADAEEDELRTILTDLARAALGRL
jgi:hypothetical protein